ncbi:MAG: sigma 54-interacting transcriptional regulator [Eubacterium sp.]|nr:sigma 54-interacting transcriptional regulator [Eubacterium sp.]
MTQETYQERLKKAREDFMNGTGHPERIIRKEILDSWIRSRSFRIDPEYAREHILDETQLQRRISKKQTLFDIATSFMEYLYQFVRGSGFMLMFADDEGYILKTIGDEDIVATAREQDIPLITGSCRLESVLGTNAIGTPLCTGKPIQLFSYEHFFELSSNWTCSGAPILQDGYILGVVCISGFWKRTHAHTLGMVMSAAEAISRQLYLKESNDRLLSMKHQLQTSIDSIHSGICLLDEKYRIAFVNSVTLNTLEYTETEISGRFYKEIFPDLELEKLKENTYDIETSVNGKHEIFPCYISIKFAQHSHLNGQETFLISFRKTEYLQKLANKIMGYDARYTFDHIIGACPAMERIKTLARKVAQSNTNVLITGESGTGKELFAQSIHNGSRFANGPFVAINCGAIPKDLIESELFGYDSGAFTGAKKEGRAGKFELANNGTIFLDEIGDMPYDVQVRLLRVLQEKTITRIGGKKEIPLNLRVIAATNVNLEEAIENRTFRSDLYYRLNVFSLHIPPLRERGNDVFLLTDYFLQKYQNPDYEPITQIDGSVRQIFKNYDWPGNIRELENVMERVCILTSDGRLSTDALPSGMANRQISNAPADADAKGAPPNTSQGLSRTLSVGAAERELILSHIRQSQGNIKKAAESLGISRRTLYRKLEKYGIVPDEARVPGNTSP